MLANGIFVDPGKKNLSKTRIPLDDHKTEILKDAIDSKFAPTDSEFDIEVAWKVIRTELNKRIYKSTTPKSGTRVRKS